MSLLIAPAFVHQKIGFVLFQLFLFLIYGTVVWVVCRGKVVYSVRAILGWAVVMRLFLVPSTPILETDHYRYLWDGLVLAHGQSPYKYAPDEIPRFGENRQVFPPELWDELAELNTVRTSTYRISEGFTHINNSEVPTIYLPIAQMAFGAAAVIGPGSVLAWRILLLLADGWLLWLLHRLLKRFSLPVSNLVIYAWSPLVLKEYVNTTHYDLLMMALVVAALELLLPRPQRPRGYPIWSGALLGAAVMTKLFPLVLIPIWIRRLGWRGILACGTAILILAVPFVGVRSEAWGAERMPGFGAGRHAFTGLVTYAHRWEFNSSLVALTETLLEWSGVPSHDSTDALEVVDVRGRTFRLDAFLIAKLSGAAVFALVWFALMRRTWRGGHLAPGGDGLMLATTALYVTGAVLLCSPVSNPWYVAWLVPLLVLAPRGPWILLTGSCFLYYLYFLKGGYIPGVRWLEYGPVYVWLGVEGLSAWRLRSETTPDSVA